MLNSTKYCITMTQDCWHMFKTIHTNIVNKEFFYAKCSEAIFLFGGVFFIRFEESFVGTDIPHKWLLIWTCQKVINKDRIYQEIWKLSARWMSVFPEDWHRLTRGSLPVKVPPHIRKNAWRSFPRQIRQGELYKKIYLHNTLFQANLIFAQKKSILWGNKITPKTHIATFVDFQQKCVTT